MIRFWARIASQPATAPAVVVDLGTTINFDVVAEKGEFLGGVLSARTPNVSSLVCTVALPA